MHQVFHRSANTIARGSIIGAAVAALVLLSVGAARRPSRLPLLPHLGREFEFRGYSSHQDLHELSLADLDQRAHAGTGARKLSDGEVAGVEDRKSTRLNSSHANISYA